VRGRSSTDARRPRPRAAAPLALIALAILPAAGCRTDPPDVRAAKRAVSEFLRHLRDHDEPALRARATCLIPSEAVRDARLRYVDPPRTIAIATIDSLVTHYAAGHLNADSLYTRTPDTDPEVESRFQSVREWGRRANTVRAARRAAARSAEGVAGTPSDGPVKPCLSVRAHVMVQYAGPAVGPDRIERDMVLRLLRAPGGPWIVYAFDLASDPPGPIPF